MKRLAAVLLLCLATVVVQADSAYTISTLAGSDWLGDGGPAPQAVLMQAEGIAIDPQGNIYVSDAQGHRVRQISPGGLIRTVAGKGVRGFSGDGGPATEAQLNTPYGLAVDRAGNLYIADLGNSRVRVVKADGRISTIAAAPLTAPRNLALDSAGSLYISDFNGNRVYKLPPGGALETVAGIGIAGFSGEGGPAVNARIDHPAGIAIDPRDNTLFIGETGNNRLRKVVGGIITSVAQIGLVTGIAVDAEGAILVADSSTGLIYRITPNRVTTALRVPSRDIALGPDGSIYSVNYTLVSRIQPSGIVTTIVGGSVTFGDRGSALEARLNHPAGVAADAAGNIYVADQDHNRIRKINPDGIITTIAGTGEPGDSGDGGPAINAQLNRPSSVTVDASGTLYIADTNNRRVRRVTPQGLISQVWQAESPVYAISDGGGTVYVSDAALHRVMRVTAGVGVPMPEYFLLPRGLALDRSGNLYVADAGVARVVRISPTLEVTPVARGSWSIPRGVAVDEGGNIYVADMGRQQIVRVLPSDGTLAIAGTGVAGFSGDGDAATLGQLASPWDVAMGSGGKLYVADFDNNRIRALTPAVVANESEIILADAVNAASGLAGPIAPGMLVSLRGSGLRPGDIPETIYYFDGIVASFVSLDSHGIVVQAPWTLATSRPFFIDIRRKGVPWMRIPSVSAPSAPGLFTVSPGQAAASNEDGTANSSTNPADPGSVIALYGTGLGGGDVKVTIGAQPAEVLFAGHIWPSGVFQVNARVPMTLSGVHVVVVTVGEAQSQPGLTLSIR